MVRCESCKFSHNHTSNIPDGFDDTQWRCRRNPPQIVYIVGPMESMVAAAFPAVDKDAWCGEGKDRYINV